MSEHNRLTAKCEVGAGLSETSRNIINDEKIPTKDSSVVLSKEEYEKLKSLYDTQQGAYMTSSIGDLPLTVKGLRKAVDEIARLIGVETELQELNANYYNEAKDLRREVNRLKAHAMINDEHLHIRIKEQARKETAKKILTEVQNEIFKYLGVKSIKEADKLSLLGSLITYDLITDKLHELAHQYGVKIGE